MPSPEWQRTSCEKVMSKVGWIGPKPIDWKGQRIDGRHRTDIAFRLGVELPDPIVCTSRRQLVRELALSGEYERAREYMAELGMLDPGDLAATLRLPAETVAIIIQPGKRRRRNNGRRRQASRADALRRVSQVWAWANETGEPIAPEHIEGALGRWLDRNATPDAALTRRRSASGQAEGLSQNSTGSEDV